MSTQSTSQPPSDPTDHAGYIQHALSLARLSPPKPTNFRVGALLVDSSTGAILASGYTLELPGNTHAEQCCFSKYAAEHNMSEDLLGRILPASTVLYTTMEPCNLRLSGNMCCVDRILRVRGKDGDVVIKTVYIGVKEPEKFVGENEGRRKLEDAGVRVVHVGGMEEEILGVATAGHAKE